MRLFFALGIDGHSALQIAHWRDRNLPLLNKSVPPQNYHITLAFLGEVKSRDLDRLCRGAEALSQKNYAQGATLRLDTLGYWAKPGILWLGPKVWPDALNQLASSLKTLGNTVGAAKDKNSFRPHVTLSRRCDSPITSLTDADIALPYHEFSLFESNQGKQGVHYDEIASWPLSGKTQQPRHSRPGLGMR